MGGGGAPRLLPAGAREDIEEESLAYVDHSTPPSQNSATIGKIEGRGGGGGHQREPEENDVPETMQ